MPGWLSQLFGYLNGAHAIATGLLGAFHVWFWARHGFKTPRYIHVLAAASSLIGVLVIYIQPGSRLPSRELLWQYVTVMLIMPALVYGTFVFYGGALASEPDPPDRSDGEW